MWISRKKYQALEKRIADLEGQVQSQQQCVSVLIRAMQEQANRMTMKSRKPTAVEKYQNQSV